MQVFADCRVLRCAIVRLLVFALALSSGAVLASGRFEDVTESSGLSGLGWGGPAAWGDYDNDGWVDLYNGSQLWRNDAGQFTKVDGFTLSGPGIWGDYDNDGYLDLFCWSGKGNLYHNEDDGTGDRILVDVSDVIPDLPMTPSRGAVWGDFNGDGYIDLYVGGYEQPAYQPDAIYMNGEGASFKLAWKGPGKTQPARGITAADFDEDGDLDVYVSNYRLEPNLLWLNDGAGVFSDVAPEYGVDGDLTALPPKDWAGHTIGSAWGDFDNDGHLDLFVGNFSHPAAYQDRPKFYRNSGPEGGFHFEDRSALAGLQWQESFATPALADLDNDGYLDLFFSTVYGGDHSVLCRNNGDWTFTDVTDDAGIARTRDFNYQAAWADYDNDGDMDLLTDGKILRNAGTSNHYVKVRLVGDGARVNRGAMGAQVRVNLGNQIITRQVEGATGEGNQNDMTLHFGLGEHAGPVDVEVLWPGGARQRLKTPVDKLVVIVRESS